MAPRLKATVKAAIKPKRQQKPRRQAANRLSGIGSSSTKGITGVNHTKAFFDTLQSHPEAFLVKATKTRGPVNGDLTRVKSHLSAMLRSMFAQLNAPSSTCATSICPELPELLVDGFDADQIWEELELVNRPLFDGLGKRFEEAERVADDEVECFADDAAGVSGESDEMTEDDLDESAMDEHAMDKDFDDNCSAGFDSDAGFEDDELEQDTLVDSHDEPLDDDDKTSDTRGAATRAPTSALDDDFFSLAEFEKFADEDFTRVEDTGKAEDQIDLSRDPDEMPSGGDDNGDEEELSDGEMADAVDGDDASDDMQEGLHYDDFFAPPKMLRRGGKPDASLEYNDDLPAFKKRKRARRDEAELDMSDGATSMEESDDDENDIDGQVDTAPRDLFADTARSGMRDEKESAEEKVTSHQRKMKRLQESIVTLEEENVAAKEWTLMGEASVKDRPVNSLLEQDLEFDVASKPAPVITEETTVSLEDLIKKRIIDTQFDDVERTLAPTEANEKTSRKQRMELNDEKPTQSLAAVYEQDFEKQKEAANRRQALEGTESTVDARTEEQKREHEEVETLFKGLCYKLDALSNWHFTPKPAQLELEVVTAKDTPAIEMEEVTPAHVSSAATLAPHEVFAPKKSELELKATEELSSAEKAKLRKAAKLRNRREKDRRAKDRKLIEKLNPGLGNKFTVGKAMQELTKKENAGNVTIIGANGQLSRGGKNLEKTAESSKKLKL